MEKSTLRDRAPTQVKLIGTETSAGKMEGKRRKNKFKEQRHQGKLSAFLESFKGSRPGGKAAAGGAVGDGSGTQRAQLNACLRGGEHAADISGPRVVRQRALWVVRVELCPGDRDVKES